MILGISIKGSLFTSKVLTYNILSDKISQIEHVGQCLVGPPPLKD